MQDWHVKRLEINRMVRAIMVRHRIDLGKITTHVYPRRIMVRGTLVRLNGAGKPLDADTVGAIFHDLERIREIRIVQHDLHNWCRRGDALEWAPLIGSTLT